VSLLLDSHALLWALHAPKLLAPNAAALIRDPRQAVYFSAASAWELEIKMAKGKLALPPDWLEAATQTGFLHLPVTAQIAQASARLPRHHDDPFDRMLVAHASAMDLRIVTRDRWIRAYGVGVVEC
jgi:PIN domain nuclease of toxin-antitoxin system